jgi:zinc and cadmium transporter
VSTLAWILVAGLLMSALALVGSVTLLLPRRVFVRLVLPLVALAAGSLLGGALFHMLPESVEALGNDLSVYGWLALGFVSFLVLEQFLHWHHCHRPLRAHRPVGYLILVADGLHNFIGGLAVGSAFVLDFQLGVVTWLVAAAHEVPQELGDFGLLVHSGWSSRHALAYNVASALTFLVGSITAYALSGRVDVTVLVPFAAGNFIYIAAADLIPQLTAQESSRAKIAHTASFTVGLGGLYLLAQTVG